MAHTSTIIHMRNVPGSPRNRALDLPLPCKKMDGTMGLIPADFEWDGSSVPWIFQGLFPRHRHPIASCRHDWRCRNARTKEDRLFADKEFERDVGTTSWWITKKLGYAGVRIGAFLGIGVYRD
jgi:hypothetical protein